ncbi:MAG: sodium-independent anion transporter, partial [Deltaproteobacteria bacterium]|nr:sodium-independent anion transporter [Deltaproteobacteria bacterium]
FKDTLQHIKNPPKILILRMRFVPMIDATALQVLEDLFKKTRREKTILLLSGVQKAVRGVLEKGDLIEKIGAANILNNLDLALARANELLADNQ